MISFSKIPPLNSMTDHPNKDSLEHNIIGRFQIVVCNFGATVPGHSLCVVVWAYNLIFHIIYNNSVL